MKLLETLLIASLIMFLTGCSGNTNSSASHQISNINHIHIQKAHKKRFTVMAFNGRKSFNILDIVKSNIF